MKPYYQDQSVTLYHGDCRQIVPQLGNFDLLLTDPPYGIFKKSNDGIMFGNKTIYSQDKKATQWDVKPTREDLDIVKNACKLFVIWGGNYFADSLGACPGILVWNKKTGNNNYADGEAAFSNVSGTMRIFTHQWCGAFKDSERGQKAMHPTQKPLEVIKWCINLAGDVQTILDPFAGSGTTGRAAKDLGKQAVLVEMDEQYCEIAAQRMAQEILL